MAFRDNFWVRVVNDFLHDIAAGAWPAAVWAIWMVRNGAQRIGPDAFETIRPAMVSVFWILPLSLAVLVATGGVRLGYWRLNVRSGALEAKRRAVLIKHTAFTLLLVASTVAAWMILRG